MPKKSAGLLLFRRRGGKLEVLLIHPGGPFWTNKDLGAWSVPKGEYQEPEDPLAAAQREFAEETGFAVAPPFLPLGSLQQRSGKTVTAWACEGDCDPTALVSNTFEMEWPRKSGMLVSFPEVDRAAWFDLDEAKRRILQAQIPFLESLERITCSS
jgi:predicted NUDIX family NTP pyrophosphohydrolase